MLTLQELKRRVDVPDSGMKIPSGKELRETGHIVASKKLGMDAEICVYRCGYAVYQICGRSTVFSIHSCGEYFYLSDGKAFHLPGEFFESEEWYLRLMLEGEDRLNRNQEERERNLSYSIVSEEWAVMEDFSESVLEHLMKQETVGEMLCLLTKKQRTVIQEYYLQGKTQMQISNELGISRSAVSDSIFHAVCKIRKKYPLEISLPACSVEGGVSR